MQKADNVSKMTAETDSSVELILEYRPIVRNFEWQTVREVVLDRLEGSRRLSIPIPGMGGFRLQDFRRIENDGSLPVVRIGQGECNEERCSLPRRALQPNPATVQLDQAACNMQPQPCAALPGQGRAFRTEEALEQMHLIAGRDTNA